MPGGASVPREVDVFPDELMAAICRLASVRAFSRRSDVPSAGRSAAVAEERVPSEVEGSRTASLASVVHVRLPG